LRPAPLRREPRRRRAPQKRRRPAARVERLSPLGRCGGGIPDERVVHSSNATRIAAEVRDMCRPASPIWSALAERSGVDRPPPGQLGATRLEYLARSGASDSSVVHRSTQHRRLERLAELLRGHARRALRARRLAGSATNARLVARAAMAGSPADGRRRSSPRCGAPRRPRRGSSIQYYRRLAFVESSPPFLSTRRHARQRTGLTDHAMTRT